MSKAKKIAPLPGKATAAAVSPREHPLTSWLIVALGLALYINTAQNEYALDDWGAITGNPYVQEGISGIGKIFTSDFWHITNIQLGYYRPLAPATFAIEHQFFGGNPHISHVINAILFAFSGLFLYKLLRKVTGGPYLPALIITLLFIAHPIHTEVIANIKGRDELLSYFNILLTIWFALKYSENHKWLTLLISLMFCYLALLSKESSLVVVILVPLFIYFTDPVTIGVSLKRAIPYAIAIAVFLLQKRAALGDLAVVVPVDMINYPYTNEAQRLPTALLMIAVSLKLLLIPHPLRYDYSYNQIPAADWNSAGAVIGLLILAIGGWMGWKQLRKRGVFGLGIAIFFVTLIPGIAFTYLRGGIFAERFLFMPSLGFCMILGYALFVLSKARTLASLKLALPLTAIFLLYSIRTVTRNTDWKDSFTLMSHDVETGSKSAQNQRHYGGQLINKANEEKDLEKKMYLARMSLAAFRKALKIYPKFGDAYCEMGICYHTLVGNIDSAVFCYNKAIECAPGLEKAYYYLGSIYENYKGQANVASFYYNEAIRYNPEFPDAKLAADRLKARGLDVHLNPLTVKVDSSGVKDEQYYFKMGNYEASQGNYAKAAGHFAKSIELKKDNEDAYINLSNCYGMLKQYDQSLKVAREYLSLHPDNVRILKNMAVTYNMMGETAESEKYLKRAKELAGE